MLDWIVQNKWKFLLLYVFKIALFFPYTAYAEFTDWPTLPNNLSNVALTGMSSTTLYFNPLECTDGMGSAYLSTRVETQIYNHNTNTWENGGGSYSSCVDVEGTFFHGNSGAVITSWVIQNPVLNIGDSYTYVTTIGGYTGFQNFASSTYYIMYHREKTATSTELFIYGGAPNTFNCNDPTTRILDFSPYDGVTLSDNNVNFTLDACINEEDIGDISGVNITLHNIDQNVLLVNEFSQSDIWLLRDRNIQQSGLYNFSTTSILGDGNYRIEACIERAYLFGFIRNPFGDVTDCQSHQFIVVQGTFIGNVSQNLWGDTNALFNGLSATSSEALAHTCNPIGGDFDIRTCLVYLFVPDGNELKKTMENARDGFLSRFPIGYITRFVTIVNSSATTTLPAFSIPVQVGNGTETIYVSMDTGETIRGGGELLDSVRDPFYNKSVRDIFEPWVQGSVALMVLMTIIGTELRAHREEEREIKRKGKLS